MRRNSFLVSLAAAAITTAALISVPATGAQAGPPPTTYYVALGDSLSVGYQPAHGAVPAGDTNQGYSDDLYAYLAARHPGLQLVKLGCAGETTTTMINGGICAYSAGSQLKAAEAFFAAHKGAVKYVTLDIGANDVDGCATGGSINYECVVEGVATIEENLPQILVALRAAGGVQGQWSGMNYYDPFLEEWLSGTSGQEVAVASVGLLEGLNSELSSDFAAAGMSTSDVATAFKSGNFVSKQIVFPYGVLPVNVAKICTWTYMCTVQNIHANPTGYGVIAKAFESKVH